MPQVNLTDKLRAEYQRLFDTCQPRADKVGEVQRLLDQFLAKSERYKNVSGPLNMPWQVIAVIHNMESSQNFDRHLHNGDPLTARTVHVPAGRPADGMPPFTWEQSAADALRQRKLDRWEDWGISGILYQLEGYNGWGYRLYHPHVLSPYLWSYSNHYTSGKYVADGTWSDTAVSRQCGACVLLRRMAELKLFEATPQVVIPDLEVLAATQQPLLRYSAEAKIPGGLELQKFLNQFPAIYLREDGIPGEKTSDAFKHLTGYHLKGDPRTG
jgi:lysozyme family protein